jgi:ligand-binding sensor domain-containing protein
MKNNMKRIFLLFFIIQVAQQSTSFAQLKADWTFYGPQFSYVDGKITDSQFSLTDVIDFKILKNGAFIFTSKKGPVTVLKNGSVKVLEKVFNTTGALKSGMSIGGTQHIAVDKSGNLFLQVDNTRLFMIDSKYFNGGELDPNNLGTIPARRIQEEEGFIYKTITALVSDPKGDIWVRGDVSDVKNAFIRDFDYKNGIAKFDGTKWETTHFNSAMSEPAALVAFDEADNAILEFPALKGGAILYSRLNQVKPGENPIVDKGVPSEVGSPVAMDFYDGAVYLANSTSVAVQRNREWKKISTVPLTNIVDMKVDKAGFVWIASNEGITCIRPNGAQYQITSKNSILPTNLVRKIAIDDQNKKWFVSDGGLVGYKEPAEPKQGMSVYTRLNSNYFDGKIQGIVKFENDLLLLNNEYGLLRFDGSNFKQETPNSMGGMFFNDLTVGKDGKVYIGTYRYLHTYDGKNYEKVEWNEDIGKQVIAVITDEKNSVWIGFDGISKFENGAWQNFNKKNAGLPSNTVYKLFKDSKGNLWGVLNDGIVKYDGATWTSFTKKTTEIGLRNMIGFAETKDGKIWFCNGSKLVETDGTTMKEVPNFKSVGAIRNMISQDDGSLLIATEEKGIAKVKDGIVTFINQASGLPSNSITRIFKDTDNAVWVSFGSPPPAPSISSVFNQPAPPAPNPKEVFTKKLQDFDIQFGLLKIIGPL